MEWKFARASLVQEFKEAHPIIPPFNLVTVFVTSIAKFFILSCGSERAKRAIEVSNLQLLLSGISIQLEQLFLE